MELLSAYALRNYGRDAKLVYGIRELEERLALALRHPFQPWKENVVLCVECGQPPEHANHSKESSHA